MMLLDGGHAVASPTQRFCELICFPHKRNLDAQLRQNNTTGKSPKTCTRSFFQDAAHY
jgi:hypothetical protein